MLSPSKLFFGTPDPDTPPDEKPVWLGDTLGAWQDSDADERTDVPAEQSLEASLNESEEERQRGSPATIAAQTAAEVLEDPTIAASSATPSTMDAARGTISKQSSLPDRPPPGLQLVVTEGRPWGSAFQLGSPLGSGPAAKEAEAFDDLEDADDERSHRSGEPDMQGSEGMRGSEPVPISELPSIGSAKHFTGNCDRCCFHPKGRCLNGFNCQHCHYDHEKRKRKNKKKDRTKQLQTITCDEMLSVSADGTSVPVSPDPNVHFGLGLLPQVDFTGSAVTAPPTLAMEQAQTYQSAQAQQTAPSGAPGLAESQWHQVATHQPPTCAPPSHPESSLDFASAQPPSYDFPGSSCQTLLGESDNRDQYISQLEAENRYLRACLIQCLGPSAAGAMLPPGHAGLPQAMQANLDIALPPPPSAPPGPPPGTATQDGSGVGPLEMFGPCPAPPGAELSATAPPFWPAGQSLLQANGLDSCYEYDPASRLAHMDHVAGSQEVPPCLQPGR